MEELDDYLKTVANEEKNQTHANREIDKTERMNALKADLQHVLDTMPASNADMLINCLSMINATDRDRFVALCRRQDVMNNQTALMTIMGMLTSFKVKADAIEAIATTEGMLKREVGAATKALLDDFRDALAQLTVFAINEMRHTQSDLAKTLALSETQLAAHLDRIQSEATRHTLMAQECHRHQLTQMEEQWSAGLVRMEKTIDRIKLRVEYETRKKITTAIQKPLLPSFRKSFGVAGILLVVLTMTATLFLYDGIRWFITHF